MGRLQLLLILALIAGAAILAVPAVLGALPDRYVARLPEPLQKYGLPEDGESILPTVSAPAAAVSLVMASPTTSPPTPDPTSSPTEEMIGSVTADLANQATATREIEEQATPIPSPTPTATAWPLPDEARLQGFQHKFQTWNNCGPATLAMALTYFGDQVSQDQTAAILKPNPEDRNVSPHEMASYVNNQTPHRSIFRANGTIESLKRFIANDIPVIVEIGIDPPGEYRWMGWYGHYLLVVAYDEEQQQFWVYDSWFGTSEEPLQNAHPDGRVVNYDELARYWSHFNHNYIVLHTPEQEDLVTSIIGEEVDDEVMWTRALARARSDIESDSANPFYWFNLGTNYSALGQYEDAAVAFDQARAIGLPWRMLWYQFGPYEAYNQVGRYEDIILLANVTLENRPYFEESFYYKGLAQAAMGELDAARQNLDRAVNFNPGFTPAIAAQAELEITER